MIAAIPCALFVNLSLASWMGANPRSGSGWGTPQALMASLVERLQAVPDLMWLCGGGILPPYSTSPFASGATVDSTSSPAMTPIRVAD